MSFKSLFIKSVDEPKTSATNDISSILENLPSSNTEKIQEMSIENVENIQSVEDLYERLEMTDKNKIYEVSPFIDGLPSSLDKITMKTSLANILRAAKFDIDELKDNADECISVLEKTNVINLRIAEEENQKRKDIIKDKLEEIKILESEIENEVSRRTQQETLFNEEITKLKMIKSYLE